MSKDKKIYEDIKNFCSINSIEDEDEFMEECLRIGFDIKQYGTTPFIQKEEKIIVQKETKTNTEKKQGIKIIKI